MLTREATVLAVDLRGFARLMRDRGIDAALAELAQFREACTVIVERHGGELVELHADNALALFASVDAAMLAERNLLLALGSNRVECGRATGALRFWRGSWWGTAINEASDQVEG